ncbi:hypothetical protein GQ42DRAFT_23955 [Ramicandelaber brevisporus]|nr:hypothetical protein GQ42DRAFT_23955 [Ramicandelaber brevisporus]
MVSKNDSNSNNDSNDSNDSNDNSNSNNKVFKRRTSAGNRCLLSMGSVFGSWKRKLAHSVGEFSERKNLSAESIQLDHGFHQVEFLNKISATVWGPSLLCLTAYRSKPSISRCGEIRRCTC